MAEFTAVFLSSTAKDLQPYRDAIAEAIGTMSRVQCERMEDFGAVDGEPLEVCRRKVAESDIFVGMVGHLFGNSPEGSDLSCSQIEYGQQVCADQPGRGLPGGPPVAEGLAEATLVDFDDEEIAAFVGRWTAAIEKAASGETRQAEKEASREQEGLLAAFAGNPGCSRWPRTLCCSPSWR
jgi:hypothetical protein